ncbi:carbohydrate-binding protein [Rothia terrae]|uniref:carbohydrate-binding protein n=1 Tax=Rothia terrae TaxID=396015 RepID=UPI00382BADDB
MSTQYSDLSDEQLNATLEDIRNEIERRQKTTRAKTQLIQATQTLTPYINTYTETTGHTLDDALTLIIDNLHQNPSTTTTTPTPDNTFKQPTGSHDAYKQGDIITYQGKQYKSTTNNNVWSPTAYPQGWEEINA